MRRVIAFLAWGGVVVCLGPSAMAWGPGAHMYVAMRVAGPDALEILYGSMAPDLFALAPRPDMKWPVQQLTHFEFDRLAPSFFAIGMLTHNGIWGADHYIHCIYDPSYTDTYATIRMKQLCTEFGFTISQTEDLVEATVDWLVRRDLGPEWGTLMAASAAAADPAAQQVVNAFAQPLSERVAGLTRDEAAAYLRTMCAQHKTLTSVYGVNLASHDDAFIRSTLVTGIAMAYGVDETTANQYVTRTEELFFDWEDGLDEIAANIATELESTAYTLPLGLGVVMVQAIMLLALAAVFGRRWIGQS